MKKISCKECSKPVANSNNVLARHVRSVHGMDWVDYYVRHELSGQWPECECGCNEKLPWRKGGFQKFIKGHENKADQNPMFKKKKKQEEIRNNVMTLQDIEGDWIPNPWTGHEEHISLDVEKSFFIICVKNDDPITKEHGLKIGWEDPSGKLHFYIPAFCNTKARIIYDFDGFSDDYGHCRLASIRMWCDEHQYNMLSLRPNDAGFDVSVWHLCKNVAKI